MKVAHVTTIDLSLVYLLSNQLLYLQKEGHEVVAISSPGPHRDEIERMGIKHMPVKMVRDSSRPLGDVVSLWRLYRLFRRERFDVVHTHNPKPGLIGRVAARMARVPIVVHTVHGYHFHPTQKPLIRRFYIGLERWASRFCDRVLFQSAEDMRTAEENSICTPGQRRYLGNGIDLERFASVRSDGARDRAKVRIGVDAEQEVVAFVGRFSHPRKGFLDLLNACRIVQTQRPETAVVLVGASDPDVPGEVGPDRIAAAGLRHLHVLGWRPNEELPELYAAVDVLVLPSQFEGVPRVLMEGSAMGIPIVATDVSGNREAVVHERNGLLVPFADATALATAIDTILSDRRLRDRLGTEGIRMARERFAEEKVFETVSDVYSELASSKLHMKRTLDG